MRRNGWHIKRTEGALVLARELPVRFDFSACTRLPDLRPLRLAHNIRQDVWRRLRHMRGFSPVVEIMQEDQNVLVRVGGRLPGCGDRKLAEVRIIEVLEDQDCRSRWVANCQKRVPQ